MSCSKCGAIDLTQVQQCREPECPSVADERLVPRGLYTQRTVIQGVRPDRDQLGLRLASVWAMRGTCARRRVGCVLMDKDGHEVGSGYNGPASGEVHCTEHPCAGAGQPSGQGLDLCEAIHAEANALLRCPDVRLIRVAYVTASPCIHCVKMLMNTACERIVFSERYAHDGAAKDLWTRTPVVRLGDKGESRVVRIERTWEHHA